MLRAEDVRAGYGAGDIIHGISVSVAAGTVASVVGPNGSGKSTLLKALAGVSWLRVTVAATAPLSLVATTLACLAAGPARRLTAGHGLELPVIPRPGLVADAVRAMDAVGVGADDIAVRTPSLDDVFLALTGGPRERRGKAPPSGAPERAGSAA